jgi:hypothetical protein
MSSRGHAILGAAIAIIAAVGLELMPAGGLLAMLITATLTLTVVVRGHELSLTFRMLATVFICCYAYQVCLLGRTMAPYLTAYTFRMAIFHFGIFAALPTIALLRCWQGGARVLVCSLAFPIALICACLVAAFEESQFIDQHRAGVGPTPRWTVSHHWLSYDSSTGQLNGSD